MDVSNKLECLSLSGFFYLSLIVVGKPGVYPSEATFRCSTLRLAPGLAHKYQTRLERPAIDENSSLL